MPKHAPQVEVEDLNADEAVAEDFGTGWARHPRERRDLLHRIRYFPEGVAEWRRQLVKQLAEGIGPLRSPKPNAEIEELRELVDDGATLLYEVTRCLALLLPGSVSGQRENAPNEPAMRMLARVAPWRSMGLAPSDRATQVSWDLVPPALRKSLRGLLEEHSGSTCFPVEPACSRCEIRRYCGSWREKQQDQGRSAQLPLALDLFSGAGGFSHGFTRGGFQIIGSVDQDPAAHSTYALNHPSVPAEHIVTADIRNIPLSRFREMAGERHVDVLIGSPPCQGFSSVGKRGKKAMLRKAKGDFHPVDESRNHLFEQMLEVVLAIKPSLVLLENVPGMGTLKRSSNGGRGAAWDLSFLESAGVTLRDRGGYQFRTLQLNASAFGVPQDRVRAFLVASRLGAMPPRPSQEYRDTSRDGDADALPCVTIDEAIYDLPNLAADAGSSVSTWDPTVSTADRRSRRYLNKFKLLSSSRLLFNHHARFNNASDLELYALLKPGEDSVHAIERYGRGDLMRYRKDAHDDKYYRLRPDKPSRTIVSHLAKDGNGFIHPNQVRSITPREAARLQSFDDGFVFCGSPTNQWVQIGNAVPPLLAEAFARSFLVALRRTNGNR